MSLKRVTGAALGFLMSCFLVPPVVQAADGISTVVASQGNVQVTLSDIDAFVARVPEKDRAGFFNSPQRIETLINNLLLQKQLAAEARKEGLDKHPDIVSQMAMSADEVLASARMKALRDEIKVPDMAQRAKEEYIGHKEAYVVAGHVSVRDIFISSASHGDEEARTLAEKVLEEAKANPDSFESLVEKYSDDPAKAERKGLVADAGSDRGEASFAHAAKALAHVGDVSGVVKTHDGYHVLRLVEHAPDRQKAFEEVRSQIVDRLTAEYLDRTAKAHTDALRNAHITANPDLVASLRTRYGSVPAVPLDLAKRTGGS